MVGHHSYEMKSQDKINHSAISHLIYIFNTYAVLVAVQHIYQQYPIHPKREWRGKGVGRACIWVREVTCSLQKSSVVKRQPFHK